MPEIYCLSKKYPQDFISPLEVKKLTSELNQGRDCFGYLTDRLQFVNSKTVISILIL